MADLILEIGTEEIPARFLPGQMENIKRLAAEKLEAARLGFGEIKAMSTPRRLALVVSAVEEASKSFTVEAIGPPKRAAFDASGIPTKAAIGFAKSQGVDVDSLEIVDTDKGEYIKAIVKHEGRPAMEILPALLKEVVEGMHFPKSMRWGDGEMRYARPVHWVLALYGAKTVEFELENIKSGNTTRGHRFLSPGDITIKNPAEYEAALERAHVIVDNKKRMESIAAQAAALAATVGGEPVYSEELLSIVACLVEYPKAVLGTFGQDYLALPDELLEAVMVGHQKYFPVRKKDRLANHFVVISNTKEENAETVRRGAQRVIKARFDDAKFYFEEDRSQKLVDRLEAQKKVTFQQKLGSLFDKTQRLTALSEAYAGLICPDHAAEVGRAALLSKCDLSSGVVCEFPELQGIMGMYYARAEGEPEAVALALREQYLPAFSGDAVPKSEVGAVLSLTDRMDNLVSFFSIGKKPTGSEDPFALRRQAIGVLAILSERGMRTTLQDLLRPAISEDKEKRREIYEFFSQRLEALLLQKGYEHDIVQAALPLATHDSMEHTYARLEALKAFKAHASYNEFLLAIKRARNIVPKEGGLPCVDDKLFEADEERLLDSVMDSVVRDVELYASKGMFNEAITELMKLNAPINKFFDKVLVMAENESVKLNRLSLLSEVWSLARNVADFSALKEK